MLGRAWRGTDTVPEEGQKQIHELGWENVTVKRTSDNNRNVGVTAELDSEEEVFTIKGRIDPLESKQKTKQWVGLVEEHILPMMMKGDRWYTQKPNEKVQGYKVVSIDGDEIILERL